MTKHIGVLIAWIIAAGLLLYVVRHSADLLNGITFLTGGDGLKGLFQSINTLFK